MSGLLLLLGILFAFSNGFRDSSTIVATVVSTRAITPAKAFFLCAICEFLGALFLGTAIAATIGGRLFDRADGIDPKSVQFVLLSALLAAISWGLLSWRRGWPISNNHALVAGLSGAGTAAWGFESLRNETLLLVLFVLIMSPIIGFLLSTGATSLLRYLGEWVTLRVKPTMERLHILSCLLVSCAHGSNDGQMVTGAMMLTAGPGLAAPLNIRFLVAGAIAGGVLLGGRRILRTLGMKFYRIRDVQGLGAEMTSAGTILACTLAGFPASTTQVIAGSIIGAGVAKSPRAVRWHVAQEIILSWVVTLPAVDVLSYGCYLVTEAIFG